MNQGLDLVPLVSPSAAFLHLLIFGPYIFKFLVKFVSPSSGSTKISPGQHPDNARTSFLISLWTLISLHKCTPRSSGYSPFEILYGRPPPSDKKLKWDHQQLAELRCLDTSRPWKSLQPYCPRNLKKDTHSFGQLGLSLSVSRWDMG